MAAREEVMADLHVKMSKKIAQLTKVVYHLNTRNDDHEYELQGVVDAYEQEIDEVIVPQLMCLADDSSPDSSFFVHQVERDAETARGKEARQSCCRSREGKTKPVLTFAVLIVQQALSQQHQREKEAALAEFEQFKQKSREREMALKQQYDDQLKRATGDLDRLRSEFGTKTLNSATH